MQYKQFHQQISEKEALQILTVGQNRINAYLDWWMEKPNSVRRFLGLIAVVIGVLFIYSA